MGGRKPTISDVEILRVFLDTEDPVLTTTEVRDAIGFSTLDGTGKRLKVLEAEGLLEAKKPGIDRLYWITDAGREYVKSQDAGRTE